MKRNPKKHTCRALIGLMALTTIVMAANILPAMAQRKTIRVSSEVAVGGLTVAEQAARSLHLREKLMTIIPPGTANAQLRIEINQKDRDDLAVTPPSGTAPLRVGVVKSIPGNIGKAVGQAFNHGVVEQKSDGSFVWAMTVTSPGAQAIRVHFTDFSLPDNTKMYFLGLNGQAHGPYVGKGRSNNGDFWTRSIVSDTGMVVLNYTGDTPNIDQPKMSFTISDVGHIRGRPPRSQEKSDDTWPCSNNADCLVDVNCVNTGPAAPAEDAVAKMEWVKMPYIYTCSGGLLVDTDDGTEIPYFLTANHCLSSDNSSLETFFNYTTDSCNGSCPGNVLNGNPPPPASTIGATVAATGRKGDFTLLILDEAPPAGAVFLGWNNDPVAFTDGANLYRISNPNFGPQVYSEHAIDTDSPTCTGWRRGQRIYSVDITGATMGGSSGSPVLNSASEVVGQLSGCCGYNCGDVCAVVSNPDDDPVNWTVDGALAYYWDNVADFLDPAQSVCDNDENCEAGEDCNNCPNDCRQKTKGNPNSRYCCDGDLPNCGDLRCSEEGWVCGGSGGSGCGGNKASCITNSDCCSNVCKKGTCRGN